MASSAKIFGTLLEDAIAQLAQEGIDVSDMWDEKATTFNFLDTHYWIKNTEWHQQVDHAFGLFNQPVSRRADKDHINSPEDEAKKNALYAQVKNYLSHHAVDKSKFKPMEAALLEFAARNNPEILYCLAILYFKHKEVKSAVNYLKQAIQAGHISARFYFICNLARFRFMKEKSLVEDEIMSITDIQDRGTCVKINTPLLANLSFDLDIFWIRETGDEALGKLRLELGKILYNPSSLEEVEMVFNLWRQNTDNDDLDKSIRHESANYLIAAIWKEYYTPHSEDIDIGNKNAESYSSVLARDLVDLIVYASKTDNKSAKFNLNCLYARAIDDRLIRAALVEINPELDLPIIKKLGAHGNKKFQLTPLPGEILTPEPQSTPKSTPMTMAVSTVDHAEEHKKSKNKKARKKARRAKEKMAATVAEIKEVATVAAEEEHPSQLELAFKAYLALKICIKNKRDNEEKISKSSEYKWEIIFLLVLFSNSLLEESHNNTNLSAFGSKTALKNFRLICCHEALRFDLEDDIIFTTANAITENISACFDPIKNLMLLTTEEKAIIAEQKTGECKLETLSLYQQFPERHLEHSVLFREEVIFQNLSELLPELSILNNAPKKNYYALAGVLIACGEGVSERLCKTRSHSADREMAELYHFIEKCRTFRRTSAHESDYLLSDIESRHIYIDTLCAMAAKISLKWLNKKCIKLEKKAIVAESVAVTGMFQKSQKFAASLKASPATSASRTRITNPS
jgi:hypothetical protein